MGRGTNWTFADDVEMCRSWLHVGQDPTVGTNQKFSKFWEKIMTHLKSKEEVGDPERLVRVAQSRFALINTFVSKFVAAHAKAQQSTPSGTNAIDLERRAMEMYRLDGEDGKSFNFKECWCVLKDNPKWQCPLVRPSGAQVNRTATDQGGSPKMQQPQTHVAPNSGSSVIAWPLGAKRTKSDIHQGKLTDRAVIAVESANILATKRQRILQDQVALGYFRLQDTDVAPELREIFLKRRMWLLKELDEEEGAAAPLVEAEIPVDEDRGVPNELSSGHKGANSGTATNDVDFQCYGSKDPQGFNYDTLSSHNGDVNPMQGDPSLDFQLRDFSLAFGI